jgi:signal transduction histidine kinase
MTRRRRPASLRTRLFVTYVLVALSGAGTMFVTARLLVPQLFDREMRGTGRSAGGGGMMAQQRGAVVSSLNTALLLGLGSSLVLAGAASFVLARRILRPVDGLRTATRHLAAGRYDEPVAIPDEPELAALAHDINRLGDDLAATERRRAALIGDVAHEMRTPLTTITGYVDGARDGLFTVDEMTAAVSGEVDRLGRLARDLAAVSKAEERPHLEVAPVDLGEIVATVAERMRPRFAAAGVRLQVDPVPSARCLADRARIEQALTNLLANAAGYTASGGATSVSVAVGDGQATVSVADTGRGIAAGDLEHVFERFYRAAPDHAAGTGIGLTIARSIARAHDGDLVAASEGIGHGTTMRLTLPLDTVDETASD